MAAYDIDLKDYWRILKKRKLTVIITALVFGSATAFFAIMNAPSPQYTSICNIKFEKDSAAENLYGSGQMPWFSRNDIDTQVSIIKSYSVLERAAKKLKKIPENDPKDDPVRAAETATIVQTLQARVVAEREELTNIIRIEVTDSDPAFSQQLCNAIAMSYRELNTEGQNQRAKESIDYIVSQLEEVRRQLQSAEDEFNQFTQRNQLISFDLQSENLLAQAKDLKTEFRQIAETRSEFQGLIVRLNKFLEDTRGSNHSFYSSQPNKQYQDANDALVGLLLKRDSLLEEFTAKHPKVIEINREIIEHGKKLLILANLQLDTTRAKQEQAQRELSANDNRTNDLMARKLEYDRLKRKVESFNEMAAMLERKNQEAMIQKAGKTDEVSIVRPAFLPQYRTNPPKTKAKSTMGFLIGTILGMIVAFVAETFDTSLAAIEEVEETLHTSVVGVVPHGEPKTCQGHANANDGRSGPATASRFAQDLGLICHFSPKSILAESFRVLSANLRFRDLDGNTKTMVVTSSCPHEGKSMVALNLAITTAQAHLKTLLVECDLRRPKIAPAFGLNNSPGLTDVLLGSMHWGNALKTITDIMIGKMNPDEVMTTPGLDNLHIMTSGPIPPNPSEMLGSKRLAEFLNSVRQVYDIVICDAPPVISTVDPIIVGTNVDAVLMVYRVGVVSSRILKRSAAQLAQVKVPLIGVVLNDMKLDASPDYQGYKYYNYSQDADTGYDDENNEPFDYKKSSKRAFWHFLPWPERQIKGNKKPSKHSGSKASSSIDTRIEQPIALDNDPAAKSLHGNSENDQSPTGNHSATRKIHLFLILIAFTLLAIGAYWQVTGPPNIKTCIKSNLDEKLSSKKSNSLRFPIQGTK